MVPVFDTQKMSGGMGKTSRPHLYNPSLQRLVVVKSILLAEMCLRRLRRGATTTTAAAPLCTNVSIAHAVTRHGAGVRGSSVLESVNLSERARASVTAPLPCTNKYAHALYHHNSTFNDHHLLPQISSASILPLRPPRRMRPTRTPTS